MTILVSGSIAFDTIVSTTWTFKSQIIPDSLDSFNLSLFAPNIRREYGWTAWNIAYNLALLGKKSSITASVGQDAEEYLMRLQKLGVDTGSVKVMPELFSAHGFIIGDQIGRQITAFHPGAMSYSWEISIGTQRHSYAIISPDAKEGMVRRMKECNENKIFTIFDPGQAMGLFEPSELNEMVVSADATIMNEYEANLFLQITGESLESKSDAFGKTWIITQGENWSKIYENGEVKHIPSMFSNSVIDATGCGDAYRWWLLYGLSEGWNVQKSCKLWSILWWIKIWYFWGQNHSFDKNTLNELGRKEYREIFFA